MITFKSRDEIPKARLPTHLAKYIDKIFIGILQAIPKYDPEQHGHVVLITPTDTDQSLCEKIGSRYSDNIWEGVSFNKEFNVWQATYIQGNTFTVSVISPCEAWLDSAIRARMVQETA